MPLSGCDVAAAFLIADHHAHVSNRNRNQQQIQSNDLKWEIFTCSELYDFKKDGYNLTSDVVDKGKTEFFVGDKFQYVLGIYNAKGKNVRFFGQEKLGEEPRLRGNWIVKYDEGVAIDEIKGVLTEPGNWYGYWTLDGVKIGEHRIIVREDPAKVAGR